MTTIITKLCKKCSADKKDTEFYKRSNGSLQDCCKKCFLKRCSKYQKDNKDGVNKRARNRYRKNPEKYKSQSSEWYKSHPDIRKVVNSTYREKNLDKTKQWIKDWEKRNPEKVIAKGQNYRARKAAVGGKISGNEWKELKEKYKNTCLCCKRTNVKLELDHIIPISKNGRNVIENAQPLCRSCNAKKNAKMIDYRK